MTGYNYSRHILSNMYKNNERSTIGSISGFSIGIAKNLSLYVILPVVSLNLVEVYFKIYTFKAECFFSDKLRVLNITLSSTS